MAFPTFRCRFFSALILPGQGEPMTELDGWSHWDAQEHFTAREHSGHLLHGAVTRSITECRHRVKQQEQGWKIKSRVGKVLTSTGVPRCLWVFHSGHPPADKENRGCTPNPSTQTPHLTLLSFIRWLNHQPSAPILRPQLGVQS